MIDLNRAKVNKRIPKNRFKTELSDVDTVTWLYKISADTADFRRPSRRVCNDTQGRALTGAQSAKEARGDEIEEIQVFAVSFKSGETNKCDLAAIQKAIPYPILFTAHGKSYFTIESELFGSDKNFIDGDSLVIEKRSAKLTDLYDDIAAAFIPIARRETESIADFSQRYKRLQVLEREIAALQRKVDNEKQPNKRIELNEELKRIRALDN